MGDNYEGLKPYFAEQFKKMDKNPNYKGKFNIFAFLFSCIWLLTKGCTKIGLILLAIGVIGSTAMQLMGAPVLSLAIFIALLVLDVFVGLRGNYFYYQSYKAKRNIQ